MYFRKSETENCKTLQATKALTIMTTDQFK